LRLTKSLIFKNRLRSNVNAFAFVFVKQVKRLWELFALLRSSTANVFRIENHAFIQYTVLPLPRSL